MPPPSDPLGGGTVARGVVGEGGPGWRGQPPAGIATAKGTGGVESEGERTPPGILARAGAPAGEAPEPLSRVQRAVARHMVEAAAVPTFAAEVEVDMTACSELRRSIEPRPSFNDLVVKACALALREHPRVNASYSVEGF